MTRASDDPVRRIADAVLYEGYILWPYRRSALKNTRRWTFGGVHPGAYTRDGHEDDRCAIQAQCLLEGREEARLDVRVRFLHVVERRVARADGAGLEYVDELTVEGERHLSWQEASERELAATGLALSDLVESARRVEIAVAADETEEPLVDSAGARAGAVVRSWRGLSGMLEISAERPAAGVHRLTVTVENTTPWEGGTREQALERTFASTHMVLRAEGADFVSPVDPPEGLAQLAEACENVGVWPVLVGRDGERHTVLASPIILEDYPRIAPESPGDLFDGGEIDELLTLNILGLTEEEQREMRASDPRTREILERSLSLAPEELMRLHGAVREFRPPAR